MCAFYREVENTLSLGAVSGNRAAHYFLELPGYQPRDRMSRQLTTTMGRLRGLLAQHAPLSASMLSVVAGVSRIRLASALRGECYLGAQREADLLTTAHRCVAALEAIRPFEIAAGDGATLKLLVDSGRDAEELRSIMMLALEPNQ